MCWEPPLFETDEEYEKHKEYLKEQANLRKIAEQERCNELRLKMEQAICKNFSGKNLIQIQYYKDAIFLYLRDNAKYGIENSESILGRYIAIYYKNLTGQKISINEYLFLQSASRTTNNIVTELLYNKYLYSDDLIKDIAIDIGIEKSLIIEMIENANESNLYEFKNKILILCKQNEKSIYSTSEIIEAFDTVRKLRREPSLMGLTYDGMRLKFDKILPPLRKNRRF